MTGTTDALSPNLSFWHTVELPDGRILKGQKSLEIMKVEFDCAFSRCDLAGKTVLDLGTWSGAFAVEAAKRGAKFVTAVDYVTWRNARWGRDAFDYVTKQFDFDIRPVELDLDTSPLSLESLAPHDVVLFLGVFYHLKDPIAALREIYKITQEVLVLETYIEDRLPKGVPAMMFYPGKELVNDPTNWWGPNIACVNDLLLMAGFSRVEDRIGAAANRHFFYAYR